jgi:hypothetical protein
LLLGGVAVIENNVLQIYTIPAKLDISTVKPLLSEKYVPAELDIGKTPCYVEMQSRNITCEIDSSACFAEEGHKTVAMLTEDYAREGIEAAQAYTHQSAVIGQMFVHSGKGENVINEVAKQKVEGGLCENGIKFIPSQRPAVTWNENELAIDGHPSKYTCNWTTTTLADLQLERKGSVTINEIQKPEIHIDYVGKMFSALDERA